MPRAVFTHSNEGQNVIWPKRPESENTSLDATHGLGWSDSETRLIVAPSKIGRNIIWSKRPESAKSIILTLSVLICLIVIPIDGWVWISLSLAVQSDIRSSADTDGFIRFVD